MAPFEATCIDQERIEQTDVTYGEWAIWGAEDARAGKLPSYANDAYLSGYVQAIKTRFRHPDGTIVRNMCSITSHCNFDNEF